MINKSNGQAKQNEFQLKIIEKVGKFLNKKTHDGQDQDKNSNPHTHSVRQGKQKIQPNKHEESSDLESLDDQDQEQVEGLFDEIQGEPESIKSQDMSQQQNNNPQSLNLQDKIISILKNPDFRAKMEQKKKKVTFADQNKNNPAYLAMVNDRRWDQKLKNPRKGKFDPEEKRTLIQNLSQCLAIQNLQYDEVVKAMSEDQQKIPRNLKFWTKVCSILPDRSIVSSYKFLKRELSAKNKGGEWTEDQVLLLQQLVEKYGRKWSKIAKYMNRTSENIRDKYRLIGIQKYEPSQEQTIWKFQEIHRYLKYLQKYSKIKFLKQGIEAQLEQSQKHDEIELKQMKQKKYNSKRFNFHNNETVRKYIGKQFNGIKVQSVNWQKISDKLETKTIFDCRNKFIQLLQLEIFGMNSKQFYERQIVRFISQQNPRCENEIKWDKWRNQEVQMEQARNRWMIFKRHLQGRGQKSFKELVMQAKAKVSMS